MNKWSLDCPYCGQPTKYTHGKEFLTRAKHTDLLGFWRCEPCDADCPSEDKTRRPIPPVLKRSLRAARKACAADLRALVLSKSASAQISNAKARINMMAWLEEKTQVVTADDDPWQWSEDQCLIVSGVVSPILANIKKAKARRKRV